jgi:hypothetical protein
VGGRILLEDGGNNTLPLSVWPTVLRRAAQQLTLGLFGLLRNNGPIIEALVNRQRDVNDDNNDNNTNSNNNESSLSTPSSPRRSRRLRGKEPN